jgi:hypothetical protein
MQGKSFGRVGGPVPPKGIGRMGDSMTTRWGVVMGVVVSLSMSGWVAAQEDAQKTVAVQDAVTPPQDAVQDAGTPKQDSKDQELERIKKRLDALEQEKAQRDADALNSDGHGADPADAKWYDRVHIGGGIRTEFRAVSHGAPNGNGYSQEFNLDNARLYTGATINNWLSATLNAEFNHSTSVLDAICQAKISDSVNIWTGRLLPATDRSNFDGPFYLACWDFPALSDAFNATGKTADRDNGVTVWGDVDKFKYWGGVYEGLQPGPGAHLLWAGRVQYDLMDDEKGYYLQSTYYGSKKILAVGLAANYQVDAAGPAGNHVPMGNVSLDILFEESLSQLGNGVLTFEFAYYYFGRHGYSNTVGPVSGQDAGAGNGVLTQVSFLIPGKVGWGEFQPFVRYEGFDSLNGSARAPASTNARRYDIGVNYVMEGHNARISLVYTHEDFGAGTSAVYAGNEYSAAQVVHPTGMIVVGTQFQF